MKILVLTCSTGGGHNSCAKYITEEFIKNGISCTMVDYFTLIGKNASKIAESLYLASTKGKGRLFEKIYKIGEIYNKTGLTSPIYTLNKMTSNKILKYIDENNFNVVICTHLFPSLAITALKDREKINLINVATDYHLIPFWNETKPNYFIIPSKLLKNEFKKAGFKDEQLISSGIPISSNFKNTKSLNLPKDKKRILIASGSMGFGNLINLVKEILQKIDAYVIVVTGNNQKMYHELKKINNSNLIVTGFVNNFNDYIAFSNIVLTKPGGLTTTEVAVLNKPIIHINPIPGVENYNALFFKKNKMALIGINNNKIIKNIKKLFSNSSFSDKLRSRQEEIINGNSASDLVKFVLERFNK